MIIEVLVSPDLSEGSWSISDMGAATVESLGGDLEQITLPLESGGPRKFARLKVTLE